MDVTIQFSSGAPVRACFTLLPSPNKHGRPQTSNSPYSLHIDSEYYLSNKRINITVLHSDPSYSVYRGILIQARRVDENGTIPIMNEYLLRDSPEEKNAHNKIIQSIVGMWHIVETSSKILSCKRYYNEQMSNRYNSSPRMKDFNDTLTHTTGEDIQVNTAYQWSLPREEIDPQMKIRFM
ncbi:unnamed protein product [Gordionus sp. m RMFG-2023]